jgi:hypothetical protein
MGPMKAATIFLVLGLVSLFVWSGLAGVTVTAPGSGGSGTDQTARDIGTTGNVVAAAASNLAATANTRAQLGLTNGASVDALTVTNLVVPTAITLSNGTSLRDGILNGTNGLFFTINGTNYWILLSQ